MTVCVYDSYLLPGLRRAVTPRRAGTSNDIDPHSFPFRQYSMSMVGFDPFSVPFAGIKGWSRRSNMLTFKPDGVYGRAWHRISCSMNINAAQSDENGKLSMDLMVDKARKLWDSSPEEVKSFPWDRALENFIQLILDIILAVIKFLYMPVMAITSVSEMSYCAHERKLFLVPLPLLVGVSVAGILRKRALDSSPFLKDAQVPWHLYANLILFTLIKLPGPYYPYWARFFIPHFANGGLFRTLWFVLLWYRRPQKAADGRLPETEA